MAGAGLQEKAIEAVVIMNTAIINLRMYPPTNAMIVKTIDRLYDMLQNVFEEEDDLLLSESERSLLVSGEPLTQKNREKPQVAIFLMLMLNWGIKSIGFNKNLDKDELSLFLEIMGKKPDDDKEKGLEQLISEGRMPNIQINQKVYVEMGKDREIVAELGITDDDIIKYVTAENPDAVLDPEKIKEMAKDPEWVSRIFKSGMHHLVDQDAPPSNALLSESMVRMLRSFDKISDHEEKERLSQLAAKSISDMDADFIATMLTKNMDDLLENRLFDQIIDRIDHDKFEHIAMNLHQAIDAQDAEGKGPDGEKTESVQQAYQHLMNTDKGVELQHQIKERQARERQERENRILEIKEKFSDFLSKLDEGISADSVAGSLPEMMDTLYSEGETETAETILERLTGKLQSDRADIRRAASGSLAAILENFPRERQTDALSRHLDKLLAWIKSETSTTGAFDTICMLIKDLAKGRIRNRRFADSLPIVDAFSRISSPPAADKDDGILSVASSTLRELASADALDVVMEEFRFDKQGRRHEAGRHLIMTAEYSISRLLDLLLESDASSERVLILNLIPEIGPAAAPAVIERIEESAPWYYLRNLARLMGRIGNEEDAKILAPLLVYADIRVQREALRSVNSIGGAYKGEILLNALSGCDDQLKVTFATTLGSLKHRDAVKPLMELFKSKLNLSDDLKVDLQEKICIALGNIGDKEALPFLTEVSKQSGIFGFKSYNPKVKTAAARAAGMLSKI
jgi:hypothetical protein